MSPTAGSTILRKVQNAFKNAKQGDTYSTQQFDVGLEDCENVTEADGDDGKDGEDDAFDTRDACGKALALIKEVCFVMHRQSLTLIFQ